jgi:enoyl-CoA hydratase
VTETPTETSTTASTASEGPQVIARIADGVGRLTLNRPRAINALSHEMIGLLTGHLARWVHDSEVALVVFDGAGDRGLCAGGDIRELWENDRAGRNADSHTFFREEYRLNALIARYPKPIVAMMDGVTMGGGIGLAGHAAIRIVTERSRLAMPETRIGFAPDVGGTWLLAHAPGRLGEYLGLNSATMSPSDAIECGFADAFVPSERIPHLLQALAERADPGTPSEIVLLFDETPPPSELLGARSWIDECYSAASVDQIRQRLLARPEPAARQAAAELDTLSPTALTVTLAAIRRARGLARLEEALELEYRATTWLIEQDDLREGIRAQVIDKDRAPQWGPEVPDAAEAALSHDPGDSVFG